MTAPEHCPVCGAILLPNSPGGQCLRCLLIVADDDDDSPESEAESSIPHRRFGDYELLEPIAQGGMGKVWRARHVKLQRIVALKMIHAGRFASTDEVQRFRREAEAAASLDHPNIVPVFEVGEHEEQQFFSMKLVEGQTLAERLAERKRRRGDNEIRDIQSRRAPGSPLFSLSANEAARLLAKIARAVHHAHQRGIMHRDLKPSNILLDAEGEPHLTDFGLARLIDSSADLTGGGIVGSIGYMAPEQAAGKPKDLTTAADVYALGCILYELLTGQPPHHADTPAEMLRKMTSEEVPSPRTLNRAVDRDLETICLKCLEHNPQRRYSSAAALAEDLERWLNREPVLARPVGPLGRTAKWIKRHPLKLALIFMTLLAIAGPIGVVTYYVVRELPYRATVHQIQDDDLHGVFKLEIYDPKGERCTLNFTRNHFASPTGKTMRVVFTNVPPEWLPRLAVRIQADQAGRPDPPRSPVLTNGQTFTLKVGSFFDRAFYCAEVGWAASNLISVAPQAMIRLEPVPHLNATREKGATPKN